MGYITPIVVDENNVILAGHTRYFALSDLGRTEAECIMVDGLTDEQKRKFRILDNKTAEIAEWDEDLLKGELEGLDLGNIHWFDNLTNPAVEELSSQAAKGKESKAKKEDDGPVICPRCGAVVSADLGDLEASDDEAINWSPDEA